MEHFMNIQTQCCGIVVLIVLLLFYRRQDKVKLNTEKAYLRAFCVTVLSITMDILSIVAIVYGEYLPIHFVKWVCKTYLVTMIGVALSSLLYIYADLYSQNGKYRTFVRKYIAIALLGVCMIYALPIHIHYSGEANDIYTYGPSTIATYLFAISFVIMNTYSMIKHRERINAGRREAVFVWMAVLIVAAVTQFIFQEILVIGYAFAIGIMVLYLKLENPEQNLDRRTGLFNQNAFVEYTQQLFVEGRAFSLLSLYFERLFQQNVQEDINERLIMELSRYLLDIPGVRAFKNAEDEIVLLSEDLECINRMIEELKIHFNDQWGKDKAVVLRLHGICIPDIGILANGKDISYFLRYIRENSTRYTEDYFLTVQPSMVDDMYEERLTEQLILSAIEEERFEVFYQPIYSTREHKFTCAEALVRMRDERDTLIPPGEFIGVAEKNGLIIRLGEMVFEEVCRQLHQRGPAEYGLHYIEVNLSMMQCTYLNLADDFIGIMQEYKIDPSWINLEITESASLEAKHILEANMKKLMDFGVRFSLDDFGTGQSNLNYIVDMPVDIVKFDKSMTESYFENGKAKYVMGAAMHMIQGMNLAIVSEGIETKEQFETMCELGIQYIQGFYFSRPLPREEFWDFLMEENV